MFRIFIFLSLIFTNFLFAELSFDSVINEAKSIVNNTRDLIDDSKDAIDEIFEGETFEGCGENEQIAREELAKNIYVKVESSFSKTQTANNDDYDSDIKSFSSQSTNMNLANIKIRKKNSQTCAYITKESLKTQTDSLIKKVRGFSLRNLPSDAKEAHIKLSGIIKDTVQVIQFVQVLSDEYSRNNPIQEFQKKLQAFESAKEKLQPQSISFNLASKDSRIYIDGNKVPYKINQVISLPTGDHQYSIRSESHCEIKGDFKLKEYEDKQLEFDVYEYKLPEITIFSNKKLYSLRLNNQRIQSGDKISIPQCSGEINYEAEYRGGYDPEFKKGSIALSPNLKREIELNFISQQELKRLGNLANSFRDGSRLEFLYSYSIENQENTNYNTHNFNIGYVKTKKHFRYGLNFSYGQEAEETEITELTMLLALQLTQYGSKNKPFHFGSSVAFVPYFGLNIGVGYHKYLDEVGEIKTIHPNDEKPSEETDFFRDYFLLKPVIGVDFLLNEDFAFKLFADYSIYIDNRITLGAGLSVKF